MRIAIISDIHGNSIALDVVLQDIAEIGGVDEYWFLGDYAAIGHDPVGVLTRLHTLARQTGRVSFIRGNTDRMTWEGVGDPPSLDALQHKPALMRQYAGQLRSFNWTLGALASAGHLPWLKSLPLEHRAVLADGTRVLCVHASPGKDDGAGLHPYTSDEQLRGYAREARDAGAALVFIGHTQVHMDVTCEGVRFVNPGCVGNPIPADIRASYMVLDHMPAGHAITLHRVEYDHAAVIAATREIEHPSAKYIIECQLGRQTLGWQPEAK